MTSRARRCSVIVMASGRKRAAEPRAQGSGARDHRTQKIKSSVERGGKTNSCDRSLKSGDSYDESHSDSSSSSRDNVGSDPSGSLAIRRPTYWLEMRGIKSSENSTSVTGKDCKRGCKSATPHDEEPLLQERTSAKKKRLCKVEDEDFEVSKESRPLSGKKPKANSVKKRKVSCIRKDPPSYPAGSAEEGWYLRILDQGKITCPKCCHVARKTVEGLKMHMANCKPEPFTCQHCGKQLKSSAGMKYHLMADHNNMPVLADGEDCDAQLERDRLRVVLRQLGKLKCAKKGCSKSFSSLMGFHYHMRKCGKAGTELDEMALKCHHCGKAYQSRPGLLYHLKAEHVPMAYAQDGNMHEMQKDLKEEESSCIGKVQRRSAKIAIYHLHEIATEELIKEWPKRKVLQDLVPDERKLKYSRPGLPTFSQEVIRKWRSEMKSYRRIRCPNKGCESAYTSVSGLKAHLGSCTKGDFVAGKYKCLLCDKEFNSESGVKYHINFVHSEEWFVVNAKSTKTFEKLIRTQQKDKKPKKKKQATRVGKKKAAVKKPTAPLKKPPSPAMIKNGRSERMRDPPSDSESDDRESSHSSMEEEEVESVIWRARQPIVKPAALSPVNLSHLRPGLIKAAVLKPGLGKTPELKPGLIKAAVLSSGLGNTTELKPGLGKTSTMKPGLIKAAVLKLDRRRK